MRTIFLSYTTSRLEMFQHGMVRKISGLTTGIAGCKVVYNEMLRNFIHHVRLGLYDLGKLGKLKYRHHTFLNFLNLTFIFVIY